MEKTSWNDRVKYGEVLHNVNKERNILHTEQNERRLTGIGTSCLGTAF